MVPAHIWILVAKSFSEEITLAEKEELDNFLAANPPLKEQLEMLSLNWPTDNEWDQERSIPDTKKLWQKIHQQKPTYQNNIPQLVYGKQQFMFRNYLKTMLRSLGKNKTFSLLNIFGLAIGIICTGLIFLWVEDELNYDKGNVKKDRLYQVKVNQAYDTYTHTHNSTPGVLGPAIKEEIPGVANVCRTTEGSTRMLFNPGEKAVYASGKFVDPSLFDMFTLHFLQGSAKTAFAQLYSLVITEKTAKKFFGDEQQVIGKSIRVNNKQDYVVSAVLKDLPENSTLNFEWLAPFEVYYAESPWAHEWGNNTLNTFVELKPGVNASSVNSLLAGMIKKRVPDAITEPFIFNMNYWHLYNQFENGKQTGRGAIASVQLFSIVAWIILLIACINFMNLATARSEKRAREVGVRKVLGAGRSSLIARFMGEAMFMAFLAAIVAVMIIMVCLPSFNMLVQKNLSIGFANMHHLLFLLGIVLVCGLVAGSYPSFYLSSFNPAAVLKGLRLKAGSATVIRKSLVVLQFSISIILIISTIIVYQQINHVKDRKLGFNKENLIEVSMAGDAAKNFNIIKQQLLNSGKIADAALADHETLYDGNNTSGIQWAGKPKGTKILISGRGISSEYFATTGMKLIEGRNLQANDTLQKRDSVENMNVVITASLAKMMGSDSPIGKTLYNSGDDGSTLTVAGVVNDHVYGNMYGQADPVIYMMLPEKYANLMYIRAREGSQPQEVISLLQDVMKANNPAYPLEYHFVDDQFNDLFKSEMLTSKLSRVFAFLAIIISCLGLFGLAAYTAERRRKEIGIRKVLGASVNGLAGLLSKEFLQLIIISCLLAFPVAWLMMNKWLENFGYRVNISWWAFIFAGAGAMIIAWLAVSFQTVKAAMANPVTSLRAE